MKVNEKYLNSSQGQNSKGKVKCHKLLTTLSGCNGTYSYQVIVVYEIFCVQTDAQTDAANNNTWRAGNEIVGYLRYNKLHALACTIILSSGSL